MLEVNEKLLNILESFAKSAATAAKVFEEKLILERQREQRLARGQEVKEAKEAQRAVNTQSTNETSDSAAALPSAEIAVEAIPAKYKTFSEQFRGFNYQRKQSRDALDRHLEAFDDEVTYYKVKELFDQLIRKLGREKPWGTVAICNALKDFNINKASALVMFLQWATLCQYEQSKRGLIISRK